MSSKTKFRLCLITHLEEYIMIKSQNAADFVNSSLVEQVEDTRTILAEVLASKTKNSNWVVGGGGGGGVAILVNHKYSCRYSISSLLCYSLHLNDNTGKTNAFSLK